MNLFNEELETKQSVHFSSASDNWATPQELFNKLNKTFGFELDPCASDDNYKCDFYYTQEQDGLIQPWHGKVFMNPPYGKGIGQWIKKAYEHNNVVVCLLPARTDTKWWQDYCMKADCIHYVRGRIKFGGHSNSAPFPSAIVIFNLFKGM